MKYLLFVSLFLTVTGCATKSIHEECSNPQVSGKYLNYEQCYSERTHQRDMDAQAKAERGRNAVAGWNAGINSVPKTTHCTSDALGNTVYTDCH